jgi:hypothetical protein
LSLSPREDERPHRIHLLIPHRLRIRLLGQFVESEPDGALNGSARLLLRLPLGDFAICTKVETFERLLLTLILLMVFCAKV